MKHVACVLCAIVVCLSLPAAARGQRGDEQDRQIAADIGKGVMVQYLKDWKREFHESGLEGKAKAVEPEKHVRVTVDELLVVDDRVTVAGAVDARFEFAGKLTEKEKTVEFEAEGDVRMPIAAKAVLKDENGRLTVKPEITRLKFEVKVLTVKPSDLPGGKRGLERQVESALNRQKDKIQREFNDWLRRQSIGVH